MLVKPPRFAKSSPMRSTYIARRKSSSAPCCGLSSSQHDKSSESLNTMWSRSLRTDENYRFCSTPTSKTKHIPNCDTCPVLLPRATYLIRDYSASTNPPVLHRKETLVDVLHPSYSIFSELTREEDVEGLLSRSDIGLRQAWLEHLASNNMTIVGHRLIRNHPASQPPGE